MVDILLRREREMMEKEGGEGGVAGSDWLGEGRRSEWTREGRKKRTDGGGEGS